MSSDDEDHLVLVNSDDEDSIYNYTDHSWETFTVLTAADIRRRLANDLANVSAALLLPASTAAVLLHHHRWCRASASEAWFSDEARAREQAGLLHFNKPHSLKIFTCGKCFERYGKGEGDHAGCGHMFCHACMRSYISVSIEDGPGCLSLRCPDPSCGTAVDQDLVDRLCSDESKKKYAEYMFRSYIEDNYNIKRCPAPGCEMAVEFHHGGYDVACSCSHAFCWNCKGVAHRPVDCDTFAKWILKCEAESEKENRILSCTKHCPKCKTAIEKWSGRMHVTCLGPCGYEFCWICLGPWSAHEKDPCNRYVLEGRSVSEGRREKVGRSVTRYKHCYDRWVANELSRLKATEVLVDLEKLVINPSRCVTFFLCIRQAWERIVECRRALKWSYVYGYYFPEEEKAKRDLFEFWQGEAELGLERLHQCAEKGLKDFLEGAPKVEFRIFLGELNGNATVQGTYFKKFVKELENGVSVVES